MQSNVDSAGRDTRGDGRDVKAGEQSPDGFHRWVNRRWPDKPQGERDAERAATR